MDRKHHSLFAERFVRNQNRVYGYIVTLVPDRGEAEDLFQQTSLTLWETWDRYDPALDFVRWACGIAHNHIRNHFRKRRSPLALSEEVLDQLGRRRLDQDPVLETRRLLLERCLGELNDRHRRLIDLVYSRGCSLEEIARQEDQSANALSKIIRRLRALLQDCISRRFVTEQGP